MEHVDDYASGYVPEQGDLVMQSTMFTGNDPSFSYEFEFWGTLAGHIVTFYIDHADGTHERLTRVLPEPEEFRGNSFVDIAFPVEGHALVTAVADMWDKEMFFDEGGPDQSVDPDYLASVYADFQERTQYATGGGASDHGVTYSVVETQADAVGLPESFYRVGYGDGVYSVYADNYRPPQNGGFCLGSFGFSYYENDPSDDVVEAMTGFRFEVDKKYAGMKAKAFISDTAYVKGPDRLNPEVATHEVTIDENGVFTIPYGYFASWDLPGSDDNVYGIRSFTDLYGYGNLCKGVVTVNIEPKSYLADGTEVDFNDEASTVVTEQGMSVEIIESDFNLNVSHFEDSSSYPPMGYERPSEGGTFAGAFSISAKPYGREGSGSLAYRVELGREYAGRTVTVYSDSSGTTGDETNSRTYRLDSNGSLILTDRIRRVHNEEDTGYPSVEWYGYRVAVNIEPADTVSIADAVISPIPDQTWSGSPATPKPTVTLGGKVLTEGTDYELSYRDNDKPGTATVTVTGKGAYSGTVEAQFKIVEGSDPTGPTGPTDPDTPTDPDDPAPTFPDVAEGAWYHDAVIRAAELGVMNGYSGSGKFGPLDWLTREQAAAVMFNYLGDNDHAAPPAPHKDVLNDWYTDAVNWAVSEGVMGGYAGSDLFGVGRTLTREEFCAVIANAAGADLDAADTSALSRFADGGAVSAWARPAVAWAVEAGIMNGVEMGDGSRELQATRGLVRAEMAAMTVSAIDAGVLEK